MPRTPHRLAPLALAACLLPLAAHAQATFTDPANLAGERPTARTGRELPIDTGSRGLQQLLRRLSTRASILNIVAHPDDEDGGMLTLYSRGLGARVADLSLTRGEGGQNAMTGDFEDALGLLRTEELLSNDRFLGITQFFGTEVDFGFSKTKSESFSKWTHQRVLYDVVRAIRIYRPLVITSTWIGNPTDGHGQHQVSGEIAQEAFVAAGDPNVFPELTAQGILPWQPLRVYARVPMSSISPRGLYDYATGQYVPAEFHNYVTGATSTTPPTADVTVHEGTTDPLLSAPGENPVSYVQFARRGLSEQKSQMGPGGRIAPAGDFDVAYHLYGSRICSTLPSEKDVVILSGAKDPCISPITPQTPNGEPNFFTGIDTSLVSIADLAPNAPPSLRAALVYINKLVAEAQNQSNQPEHPDLDHTLQLIASQLQVAIDTVRDPHPIGPDFGARLDNPTAYAALTPAERTGVLHELHIKLSQVTEARALAQNIQVTATVPSSNGNLVLGEPFTITVHFHSPTTNITRESIVGIGTRLTGNERSGTGNDGADTLPVLAGETTAFGITRPYFHRGNIEQPYYDLSEASLRNAPLTPSPLVVNVPVNSGSGFEIPVVVTDETTGQPISLVPPASLALSLHAQVVPRTEHTLDVTLHTRAIDPQAQPLSAVLELPTRWEADLSLAPLSAPSTTFHISFTPGALTHTEAITAKAVLPQAHILEGFRAVGYGDLPRTNFYTTATDRIVPVDLKLPTRRRIAYLPGTGDDVPEVLSSIGLPVTRLTLDDLTPQKLSAFDTVILGVRTYAAQPHLHGAPTEALLDFARAGGNVVVQYQTTEFTAADAPYPLSLGSNEKVVDETTPVILLDSKASRYPEASASGLKGPEDGKGLQALGHALLNVPNKITPADFNGWVEERGHGFLSTWDPHYTALTETHDPGAPAEHVAPQAPQRGGLITVQLGKGRWTYCAFALYRQLPEAVPGAFRLFTNLITPGN